jgi:hypothetical protein
LVTRNLDLEALVGIQNETTGGWNLVPEFTPHGWAAQLSFSPGGRLLSERVGILPGSDQANAPLDNPIAFITALQIISREKGFWMKSKIRYFSALGPTELAL